MTHIPLSLATPSFPPYLPSTHFLTAPSLPLEVHPLNLSRGLGSAVSSSNWSGRSPAAKRYLVHFGLKNSGGGTFTKKYIRFSLVCLQATMQDHVTWGPWTYVSPPPSDRRVRGCFHRLWLRVELDVKPYTLTPSLSCPFFSECTEVEPLDRFSRFMAQTTCFCARKCLFWSYNDRWSHFGEICSL